MEAGLPVAMETSSPIPLLSVARRVDGLIIGGILTITPHGRLHNNDTAHGILLIKEFSRSMHLCS